ncbi:hypothetical protein A2592_02030 [Candidatus Kaiserbacteria bacterium RIFOXYD1_FULL_42_15]|uniref:Uncharacterized protein n=1 Tax=Candidatus Kaiserbacteria bacterium RIFOXYD1_FULL_42_15 TaxID=1798532 RepID=A0A1F6FPK7_9BACT|nr:MAG: hypothetical protein A2592_02030 [Candidatus Kaiserbacteria bacterium RIFOXYD1_FULL_42_15]
MGEIISHVEITYRYHAKDKGIASLLVWFKAELDLRDEDSKKFYGEFEDNFLIKHQDYVEYLADRWRDERLIDEKLSAVG